MSNNNLFIVILAGGSGTRLWPISRQAKPKQFVQVANDKTLLEQAIDRASQLVSKEKIWICTTTEHEKTIEKSFGHKIGKIVIEPCARNTAPAILLSCLQIHDIDQNAIITFLPADPFIPEQEKFVAYLQQAIDFAGQNDAITLLGVHPTYPATGYGYIEFTAKQNPLHPFHQLQNSQETPPHLTTTIPLPEKETRTHKITTIPLPEKETPPHPTTTIPLSEKENYDSNNPEKWGALPPLTLQGLSTNQQTTVEKNKTAHKVTKFHEKPNLETAKQYLQKENIIWNIGTFCAKSSTFIEEFQTHAPEIFASVSNYLNDIYAYSKTKSDSIDYAIIEKSKKIYVVPADFQWHDVGNIEIFLQIQKEYTQLDENVISVNSKNNLVRVENKLVALVGIEDLCIVETNDTLLITRRDNSEQVKEIVRLLKEKNNTNYL